MLKVTLADGKARQFQRMIQTSFWGPDGTPLSTEQFLQQLFIGFQKHLFEGKKEA